jgi:hypothetical protein
MPDGRSLLTRPTWRIAIAVWFVVLDIVRMGPMFSVGSIGIDARVYRDAAERWLSGGDPWSLADSACCHFSGLPPTVLAFVPATAIDTFTFALIGFAVSLGAAVWIVRHVRLPLEWLLFPPLVEGVWFANPDIVMLALLLSPLAAVAPVLKVYAVVPLALKPRRLVVAGAIFAVSLLLGWSLWVEYVQNAGTISGRLMAEALGGWSGWVWPPLLAVAVVGIGLLLLDRRLNQAAWLTVPAVWPASQFHYATMALPLRMPVLGVIAAIPVPGFAAFLPLAAWALLRAGLGPVEESARLAPATSTNGSRSAGWQPS